MPDPRIRLLTLSGELDLLTQRRLRADLSDVAGDRSQELVVDLRGVTFTDSSGLALLVHTHQQLERQGRTLACVVREGPVRQLLETTGLSDALAVFPTPEEAAAHALRVAGDSPGGSETPEGLPAGRM